MAIGTLVNWALRGLQALFGIVMLGLSVTLIRGHHWGDFPSALGYAAFLGGISILAALIGLAATWISFLEGIVGAGIDGIVAILNLAGGITLAIKLKGVKCSIGDSLGNTVKLATNEFFNGGCVKLGKNSACWVASQDWSEKKVEDSILGHCRESQADMVFMFLTAGLFIATALMAFLRKRKGY